LCIILALFENFECKCKLISHPLSFFRSRDVISKGRLARGEDGLVRDMDELPRGEDGLARGEDGLARGEDGLARGEDVLARGEDELERGEDYRKLKDQQKESIFLSPIRIFQYILVSKFFTPNNAPGKERLLFLLQTCP
jgi:hypothetical protein